MLTLFISQGKRNTLFCVNFKTLFNMFCILRFGSNMHHFKGNILMSLSYKFWFLLAPNSSNWLSHSSLDINFISLREFCNKRKKWQSLNARSGLYGAFIKTSQPSSQSFWLVSFHSNSMSLHYILALSWWNTTTLLLANFGSFWSIPSWKTIQLLIVEIRI